MSCLAIYACGEQCCGIESQKHGFTKTEISLLSLDALIAISLLAVGLLAIFSIIRMPPPAAYALVGIGGAIPVIYILTLVGGVIAHCCKERASFD